MGISRLSGSAAESDSDVMRWGLLSTARINDIVIPAIRAARRSEVVAVASRDKERAEAYARERGIRTAYGGYDALLGDPEVDVVYVSLPNSLHTEWVIKAASAGKHVLCEKPLALTPGDVRRIVEAADQAGVTVQEAAAMRYHAQTKRLRSLIAEGGIGEPQVVRGWLSYTLHDGGDIRFNAGLGGGAVWDVGCYPITLFRAVVGVAPASVFASGVFSSSEVDVTCGGHLSYASDLIGQFFCSLRSAPAWGAEIQGTRGRITVEDPFLHRTGATTRVRLVAFDPDLPDAPPSEVEKLGREQELRFENVDAYLAEILALEATVLDGEAPAFPLRESLENVTTLAACLESARTGKTCGVDV